MKIKQFRRILLASFVLGAWLMSMVTVVSAAEIASRGEAEPAAGMAAVADPDYPATGYDLTSNLAFVGHGYEGSSSMQVAAEPNPVQYSDRVRLTAQYQSAEGPLEGQRIFFEVNGYRLGSAVTNADGFAYKNFQNQLIPREILAEALDGGYDVKAFTMKDVDGQKAEDLVGTDCLHVVKEQVIARFYGPSTVKAGSTIRPFARLWDLPGDLSMGSYWKVPVELVITAAGGQIVKTMSGFCDVFGNVYFAKVTPANPGNYTATVSILENNRYETYSSAPVPLVVTGTNQTPQ